MTYQRNRSGSDELPVVIVGAGPVGLTAAVHLAAEAQQVLVLERGATAGHAVRQWGHVRMFSPWRYNVDPIVKALLLDNGWREPNPDTLPTGDELVDELIVPMSQLPVLQGCVRYGLTVTGISRFGRDRLSDYRRGEAPFLVRVKDEDGVELDILARAVIDASGTFLNPNPLGAGGLPAIGEEEHSDRIYRGVPNLLGAERTRFAGQTTLVVGSGDSAFNALLGLASVSEDTPGTNILWGIRGEAPRFGGGAGDQLAARGALGAAVEDLVQSGTVEVVTNLRIEALQQSNGSLEILGNGVRVSGVDQIVGVTGYRPDVGMLRELRIDAHPSTESPTALGPLIDPNIHSCGTVPPHGARELGHPESQFYIIGMKSYGRAPTFLLLTGYEQARSVTAAIRGDWNAASELRLTLPETGVCNTDVPEAQPSEFTECSV